MSRTRTRFHITHRHGQGWVVLREGAQRPSGHYRTKKEAIAAGRRMAYRRWPSQLLVHRLDGVICAEYTFGFDPHPPAG